MTCTSSDILTQLGYFICKIYNNKSVVCPISWPIHRVKIKPFWHSKQQLHKKLYIKITNNFMIVRKKTLITLACWSLARVSESPLYSPNSHSRSLILASAQLKVRFSELISVVVCDQVCFICTCY